MTKTSPNSLQGVDKRLADLETAFETHQTNTALRHDQVRAEQSTQAQFMVDLRGEQMADHTRLETMDQALGITIERQLSQPVASTLSRWHEDNAAIIAGNFINLTGAVLAIILMLLDRNDPNRVWSFTALFAFIMSWASAWGCVQRDELSWKIACWGVCVGTCVAGWVCAAVAF